MLSSACCLLLLGVLALLNVMLTQPAIVNARESVHQHLAAAGSIGASKEVERKAMPAILHRYGTLRRGKGAVRGNAAAALRAAFPRWHDAEGALKIEETVTDLALGIAALVEHLDPVQELKVVNGLLSPPPPPRIQEPDVPSDDSEQEVEL